LILSFAFAFASFAFSFRQKLFLVSDKTHNSYFNFKTKVRILIFMIKKQQEYKLQSLWSGTLRAQAKEKVGVAYALLPLKRLRADAFGHRPEGVGTCQGKSFLSLRQKSEFLNLIFKLLLPCKAKGPATCE
jgi:hypothetical protein